MCLHVYLCVYVCRVHAGRFKRAAVRHAAVTRVFSNLTGSRIVTAYWLFDIF